MKNSLPIHFLAFLVFDWHCHMSIIAGLFTIIIFILLNLIFPILVFPILVRVKWLCTSKSRATRSSVSHIPSSRLRRTPLILCQHLLDTLFIVSFSFSASSKLTRAALVLESHQEEEIFVVPLAVLTPLLPWDTVPALP